jgi:predicted transcriptional regulator
MESFEKAIFDLKKNNISIVTVIVDRDVWSTIKKAAKKINGKIYVADCLIEIQNDLKCSFIVRFKQEGNPIVQERDYV